MNTLIKITVCIITKMFAVPSPMVSVSDVRYEQILIYLYLYVHSISLTPSNSVIGKCAGIKIDEQSFGKTLISNFGDQNY